MRNRWLIGAVAGAVVLVGVVVRPQLLLPIAVGAVAAAIGVGLWRLLQRRGAPRRPPPGEPEWHRFAYLGSDRATTDAVASPAGVRRRTAPAPTDRYGGRMLLIALLILAGTVAVAVVSFGTFSERATIGPHPRLRGTSAPPLSRVIAVPFNGLLEHLGTTGRWRWTERVRIPRRLLHSRAAVLHPGIGRAWRFDGLRGQGGTLALYERATTFAITTPVWPLTREKVLRLPLLRSRHFHAVLVPRDGSVVRLRAPRRMIQDTDPASQRTTFAGVDTLSLRLTGAEDDPTDRAIHFKLANAIGRTEAYATLSGITGWAVVAWLFGIASTGLFGFFFDRWLERHFPRRSR